MPVWSTALPDWETRIVEGRSLVPVQPLFPDEAQAAMSMLGEFKLRDVAGQPTMSEACRPWILDFCAAIFGAYDAEAGRRLINEYMLLISKKNGKALALDTPIPTPSGWTTMGDLEVGDWVYGADGAACRVTATSEVFIDHACYRVDFSNDESVVADAGHRWLTYSLADREQRVRTTAEVAQSLLRGDGARNHSIQMPDGLEAPDADVPIGPYTLGAWLGDGHSAGARITFSKNDVEIKAGIESDGWPVVQQADKGVAATYAMSGGGTNSLHARLRRLGVLNNKHIPGQYLRASRAQRLALLQGLMDTDGTVNKNGRVLAYTSTSQQLATGVAELLATFGIKFTWRRSELTCNGRKVSGTGYTLQFMAFRDELPVFRLQRKLDRMRAREELGRAPRSRTVQIIGTQLIDPVPVKCISVDSPGNLFLFGRTMLPTHNSTTAAGIMLTALLRNWRESAEFLILAPTVEAANSAFKPAADMIRLDDELKDLLKLQDYKRLITHTGTNATLRVVAADADSVAGNKATGVLIDELWAFGKHARAESMFTEATGGLASRPEGFIIYLSTQSDQPPAGVFKSRLDYARDVRDGKVLDPRFMPVLYEFPQAMLAAKQHRDPKYYYVTNPNLGASVDEAYINDKIRKADIQGEEQLLDILAKHLNVEIGLNLRSDRWAGADFWEAAVDARLAVTDNDHLGALTRMLALCDVAVVGIDGGGLDDLLGLVVLGREKGTGRWMLWAHAWAHKIVLERRKEIAPRLLDFVAEGTLTLVDKPGDDVMAVADICEQVRATGLMPEKQAIGVDRAGIGDIVDELLSEGRKFELEQVVGIDQGWRLNAAIKTTERKVAGGELVHAGSALMNWCVGNARIEQRSNSILVTKQASGTAKIDPLMAVFDAVALMQLNPTGSGGSWWETA